ncbi:MAG: transglycosylase domain-containing protein, partial [Patescibacteria group bacterium]
MGWKSKFTLTFFCCFVILGSYGYLAFWYYFYYKVDDLPEVRALINYDLKLNSTVYDDSGNPIDKFSVEDKIFVSFKDIPQKVIQAIVAAEDKNFWSHRLIPGIDPLGILRALIDNLLATVNDSWHYLKVSKGLKFKFKTISGGSTITQQTAKQIWLSNERTLKRKILEARIAFQMERTLPKELIFEIYVNSAYFGHGRYGVVASSRFYFSKTLEELTVDEAAILAGIIKWPDRFSPITNKKIAVNRRNTILRRMFNNEFISLEEFNNLKAKSITVNVKNGDSKIPFFSSFIMKRLHELGYKKVVNSGLKINTSISSSIQQIAENALKRGLASYDGRHQKRLVLYNVFSDYDLKSLYDFRSNSWGGNIGIDSIVDGLILEVYEDIALAIVDNDKAVITKDSFAAITKDVSDLTKVLKIGDVLILKIIGVNQANNFKVEILQPEVQGAVIVLDVETGGIKAIVGGQDFKNSEYNRAMQAERQAGSSFKPFVYGAYFEKYPDKDLNSIVIDSPVCFQTG